MLPCWTVFALLLASPLCSPAKCFGTAEPFPFSDSSPAYFLPPAHLLVFPRPCLSVTAGLMFADTVDT